MKAFWNRRPYEDDEQTISPENLAEIRAKAVVFEAQQRRHPTQEPAVSRWNVPDEHDIPEQPEDGGLFVQECTLSGLTQSDQERMLMLMRRHDCMQEVNEGIEELIRVEDYE